VFIQILLVVRNTNSAPTKSEYRWHPWICQDEPFGSLVLHYHIPYRLPWECNIFGTKKYFSVLSFVRKYIDTFVCLSADKWHFFYWYIYIYVYTHIYVCIYRISVCLFISLIISLCCIYLFAVYFNICKHRVHIYMFVVSNANLISCIFNCFSSVLTVSSNL
jgi:hypothetical protein